MVRIVAWLDDSSTNKQPATPIAGPAVSWSGPVLTISPRRTTGRREWWRRVASLFLSVCINVLLVAALAGLVVREAFLAPEVEIIQIVSLPPSPPVPKPEPAVKLDLQADFTVKTSSPVGTPLNMALITTPATVPAETPAIAPMAGKSSSQPPESPELVPEGAIAMQLAEIPVDPNWPVGGGLEGRWQEARTRLLDARGGTPASESAVDRALDWLAAHQREDGSWRFDHITKDCDRNCEHVGTYSSTTGAMVLAILPFLGCASWQGKHGKVLRGGLGYLQKQMIVSPRGGDLQEGSMYAQGLATIALCEAFAMTGESSMGEAAQQGLKFIVSSQHHQGGWRYFPNQPGDTTVLGWQMMALKSGSLAGLPVSEKVVLRGYQFLDAVQSDNGAAYGYQEPGDEPTPTAIGLLCRMYGGWNRLDVRLQRGIMRVVDRGYSRKDMYYNYYATQVMSHYGGPRWEAWNEPMRDYLIASQVQQGHGKGSWYFGGKHTLAGGRLCETALATLILEVYYRHVPLYTSDGEYIPTTSVPSATSSAD